MLKLTKYLVSVLGINTESELVIEDILEELSKIKDIKRYREYIKSQLLSLDINSYNGFKNFLIVTNKYLYTEEKTQVIPSGCAYDLKTNSIVKLEKGHYWCNTQHKQKPLYMLQFNQS